MLPQDRKRKIRDEWLKAMTITTPPLIPCSDSQEHELIHEVAAQCSNKKALERVAGWYATEMRQNKMFNASEAFKRPGYRFLIAKNGFVLGGGCIRQRIYLHETLWAFQFVWLHPFHRKHGIYSSIHEYLKTKHPGLIAEPPFSTTMRGFLERHDPDFLAASEQQREAGICRHCGNVVLTGVGAPKLVIGQDQKKRTEYTHLDCILEFQQKTRDQFKDTDLLMS